MHDVSLELDGEQGVSVHAGFPNPAADRRLSGLDLNQLLIRHPTSTFLFRIRGEQGITQGIFDGDLAVVDRLAAARAHDLVLWHDGQRFNFRQRLSCHRQVGRRSHADLLLNFLPGLQQLHRRKTHLRPNKIDKARHKKPDCRHRQTSRSSA